MRILSIALVVAGLLTTAASAAGQPSVPYDHVHLAVADPEKAEAWYTANLNGNVGENPGRVAFQPWSNRAPLPIQFIFLKAEDAKPSEGSVIDSVGFVVQGLEAKVKVLEAAGATLRQPVESVPASGSMRWLSIHGARRSNSSRAGSVLDFITSPCVYRIRRRASGGTCALSAANERSLAAVSMR